MLDSRLEAEAPRVDLVLRDLVADDSLGRLEQPRRACPVSSGSLEGVLNELLLVGFDSQGETRPIDCAGPLGRLRRWRQVIAVNDVTLANQRCPLDNVLKLANVARPVIAHQHIDRWSRDALYS